MGRRSGGGEGRRRVSVIQNPPRRQPLPLVATLGWGRVLYHGKAVSRGGDEKSAVLGVVGDGLQKTSVMEWLGVNVWAFRHLREAKNRLLSALLSFFRAQADLDSALPLGSEIAFTGSFNGCRLALLLCGVIIHVEMHSMLLCQRYKALDRWQRNTHRSVGIAFCNSGTAGGLSSTAQP